MHLYRNIRVHLNQYLLVTRILGPVPHREHWFWNTSASAPREAFMSLLKQSAKCALFFFAAWIE